MNFLGSHGRIFFFCRTESSHSERYILRRRCSQPEFYEFVTTASVDTDYSSVSLTSLSEDRASALELHQPCDSQQLWREGHYGKTCSSYPAVSSKPQVRSFSCGGWEFYMVLPYHSPSKVKKHQSVL